jgi:hypothetical protein
LAPAFAHRKPETGLQRIGARSRQTSSAMLVSRWRFVNVGSMHWVSRSSIQARIRGDLGLGVDQDADLEIHEEAPQVEVRGAEQGHPVVDDDRLGVEHAGVVEEQVAAGGASSRVKLRRAKSVTGWFDCSGTISVTLQPARALTISERRRTSSGMK